MITLLILSIVVDLGICSHPNYFIFVVIIVNILLLFLECINFSYYS